MAKLKIPDDESGVVVKNLGGPPSGGRGFPFRLVFWALLMTVATGFGGFYVWKFREKWKDQKHAAELCSGTRDQAIADADKKAGAACDEKVSQLAAKSAEADAQLTKMSENLNATKDELEALRLAKAETEKRMQAIEEIRAKFEEMTSAGSLKVVSRHGSMVLELPSEVLFDSGKAVLSRKGEVEVLQVGGILKQFGDRRFLIIGHTDAVPLKSQQFKDNWELSVARALTVTRFLVEGGMDAKNVIAAGAGENEPIADNKSPEGQARNRRIEIQLLPALSELPPLPPSLDDKTAPAPATEKDKEKDKKKDK